MVGMRRTGAGLSSSYGRADASDLLVVGDRGTLRPLPEIGEGLAPATGDSAEEEFFPAFFEDLLSDWLADASCRLTRAIPAADTVFCGEPIPLGPLLLLLKQRLTGLLTQAVACVCERTEQPSAAQIEAAIAANYPALLPLLRSTVAEWIAAVALFLQRLHRDAPAIAAAEHLPALSRVVSLTPASSDVHAGGHPVLRVCFAGGPSWYYKPRRVTGEWLWAALLDALADGGLVLPCARVLAPGDRFQYGWMESLRTAAYEDDAPAGLDPYWHSAGALICLAHHMRMSDLHLANILATPMGPAVVDAECLATPALARERSAPEELPLASAIRAILDTGLVPRQSSDGEPDVSGLFGRPAPVKGVTLPRWRMSPDGRCYLQPAAAALGAHHNAPAQTSALAVVPHLLDGYRDAAEALMDARSALLTSQAPWRRVLERAHAPRVLVRDTVTYGRLLSRSLLPRHLHSASRRRSALLSELNDQTPAVPAALLRMEAHALLAGHLPRWVQLPRGRTLATSSGRPAVRGFAAAPAACGVLAELQMLSRERLQQILIPALLASIW
jgi:lantibiotic modifying enzyme